MTIDGHVVNVPPIDAACDVPGCYGLPGLCPGLDDDVWAFFKETNGDPAEAWFFVYGLMDPRTDEIRYVGGSEEPTQRETRHYVSPDRNNPKLVAWIDELHHTDLEPELVILYAARPQYQGLWREGSTRGGLRSQIDHVG